MTVITSSPTQFGKLLNLQAEAVKEASTIREILEKRAEAEPTPTPKPSGQIIDVQKIQVEILNQIKEGNKAARTYYKTQAEFEKEWAKEAKDISDLAQGLASVQSIGDKIKESLGKFTKPFSMKPSDIKGMLNVGGIFDKSIARDKFIEKQRLLGSKASKEELQEDFEKAHKTSKDISKNEAELKRIKDVTGIQDEEKLRELSPEGKAALEKRQSLADVYGRYDRGVDQFSKEPVYRLNPGAAAGVTPSTAEQNKEDDHNEKQIEADRKSEENTKLLEQIAENTGGKPGQTNVADKKAEPAGDGGLMGKIGKGLNSLGEGLKGLGAGVGQGIKGILVGIAEGVKAFGSMDVLKGALVMGVLGGAVWVMGKALQEFSDLDWETIGKGLVAVAGFGVLAAVMGTAAPLLFEGALAIGAIGVALVPFGFAMKMAGEGMNQLADGLTKLDQISGDNLMDVAKGLVAIGGAMTVFAAGQAAMGLSNLVTGFFSFMSGQKTPIEQMEDMAKSGEGLVKAGEGIKSIADGMAAFAKIEPETMKAVNDFPWVRATAFAAVGGAMRVNNGQQSVEVYNRSAENQEQALATQGGGGNTHNQVIAPTTNNQTVQNQNIVLPIRNQEQSMNRYLHNKFAW